MTPEQSSVIPGQPQVDKEPLTTAELFPGDFGSCCFLENHFLGVTLVSNREKPWDNVARLLHMDPS